MTNASNPHPFSGPGGPVKLFLRILLLIQRSCCNFKIKISYLLYQDDPDIHYIGVGWSRFIEAAHLIKEMI